MADPSRSSTARLLTPLAAGILFGLGLVISGMVNPAKVIGFLDIAGAWDPTLALVMTGALAVAVPAFRTILKRPSPVLEESFSLSTRTGLDPRLLGGAVIFGVGWGLAGFCPGPALSALATGSVPVLVFVLAMLGGALACRWLTEHA
ncbi:MAG: DUF6691 family protein [Woeseia sp.]